MPTPKIDFTGHGLDKPKIEQKYAPMVAILFV